MKHLNKNEIVLISNSSYNNNYSDINTELRNYLNTFPLVFTKNSNWRDQTWEYNLTGSISGKFNYYKEKNMKMESLSIKKPKSLLFFPTETEDVFTLEIAKTSIESNIERYSRRSRDSEILKAYSYYRDLLNESSEKDLPIATYGLYDYIWTEDEQIKFSNIGQYPIENLTCLDLTSLLDVENFDPLNSDTFMTDKLFNKGIIHLPSDKINTFIESNPNMRIKMWDLKNLYRGTTPTQYNLAEKKANALSKGYKIALAKINMKVFCPRTFKPTNAQYYFYITNVPVANYNKYSKARKFFKFMIEKSSCYDGAFFFNKELFEKKMKERFGTNTMYSNILSKIFEDSSSDVSQLEINKNTQETTFNPSIFSAYKSIKQAKNNPVYSSYNKTKLKLEEFTSKVNNLSSNQSTIDESISRLKLRIESYKHELETLSSSLKEKEKTKKEIEVNLPNYIKAQKALTEKIVKQEKEYNEYLSTITISSISKSNPYAKNFAKQGIVIDKVEYLENNTLKTLKDEHEVILSSLRTKSDIEFKTIYFRILKPVTIYVDRAEKGDSCRKIIGGPYSVRVDNNNLYISLLSSASVFGYNFNNKQLWVHPHTPGLNMNGCSNPEQFFDLLLNTERRACLGEAAPAIHSAFRQKDIRQIIIATMAWVTNANSSDAWGKHQKFFQTVDELKDSSTMITTEFVRKQNIVNQLQDPEEMFNLLSDTLEDEQQAIQEEENQIDRQIEEPLPEINFSLRRPGVENYRPYNQNQEQ